MDNKKNPSSNNVLIKKSSKRFLLNWTKFDIFAIIPTMIIAIICSIFVFFIPSEVDNTSQVVIYQDGAKITSINLIEENESSARYIILFKDEITSKYDQIYPTDNDKKFGGISYLYGDMIIRVANGIVKIVEETCPKHYCSMGEISRPGQTLICAPNNVYITIKNGDKIIDDPGIII